MPPPIEKPLFPEILRVNLTIAPGIDGSRIRLNVDSRVRTAFLHLFQIHLPEGSYIRATIRSEEPLKLDPRFRRALPQFFPRDLIEEITTSDRNIIIHLGRQQLCIVKKGADVDQRQLASKKLLAQAWNEPYEIPSERFKLLRKEHGDDISELFYRIGLDEASTPRLTPVSLPNLGDHAYLNAGYTVLNTALRYDHGLRERKELGAPCQMRLRAATQMIALLLDNSDNSAVVIPEIMESLVDATEASNFEGSSGAKGDAGKWILHYLRQTCSQYRPIRTFTCLPNEALPGWRFAPAYTDRPFLSVPRHSCESEQSVQRGMMFHMVGNRMTEAVESGDTCPAARIHFFEQLPPTLFLQIRSADGDLRSADTTIEVESDLYLPTYLQAKNGHPTLEMVHRYKRIAASCFSGGNWIAFEWKTHGILMHTDTSLTWCSSDLCDHIMNRFATTVSYLRTDVTAPSRTKGVRIPAAIVNWNNLSHQSYARST